MGSNCSNDDGLVEVLGKRFWTYLIVEQLGFPERLNVRHWRKRQVEDHGPRPFTFRTRRKYWVEPNEVDIFNCS